MSTKFAKEIYIVAAKRTPFGAFGGKLTNLTATQLGGLASVAALKGLKDVNVDSVIYGNVLQTSGDAAFMSRHVGHMANLPLSTPALNVNRLCGSGFQSVISAAQEILTGEAEVVLAGGAENMSQAPYALRNARAGTRYGVDLKLEDTLANGLIDTYPTKIPMGITAENLSKKYDISRKECDEYALQSQQRWKSAQEGGRFKAEIAPVDIKTRKGTESFSVDEHPRPQTTIESLTKLPSVFIKETGTVTAGNASGISDGAASLVIASGEAVKKYNLKPIARLVHWFYTGVDPSIMGIGPVPAIQGVLKRTGLALKDMDLVEVNEAFAAQYLAVEKELGLDRSKTNTNGGAIAVGHPLGASGARITGHLAHELQRTGGKYALGSACIGGGQGIAVLLERA
ncbi:3-ketoacyl-CoA thiolase [Phlyctochytrium arcticum]|nr:3-ketoacyl-CoA thiolase [Phlyctochytrium arcticum]